MDEFKQELLHKCDIMGLHCPCCNPFVGSLKSRLNRIARKRVNKNTRKLVEQELRDVE